MSHARLAPCTTQFFPALSPLPTFSSVVPRSRRYPLSRTGRQYSTYLSAEPQEPCESQTGHGPGGSTRHHPLSDPLRPILFCSLDPSKHEKWMPPSPNWDELPVWRHFQNGRHGNWRNHVFSYNSASRADRNEISVSTSIFLRVKNSIKALTSFYNFYLTHDELPVWRHFQNGQNRAFCFNSASRVDRNEISVSTLMFFRVRNSIKAFTGFYDFYLTHDELPVWCHF